MRFYYRRLVLGPIPCPMNGIGGDALEIAFFTMKAFILYKEPDLAVKHIVYLLGLMLMRFGVITGRASRDHQAALVPIPFANNHRAGTRLAALDSLYFGYVRAFDV
jgi:hypothetical protein